MSRALPATHTLSFFITTHGLARWIFLQAIAAEAVVGVDGTLRSMPGVVCSGGNALGATARPVVLRLHLICPVTRRPRPASAHGDDHELRTATGHSSRYDAISFERGV